MSSLIEKKLKGYWGLKGNQGTVRQMKSRKSYDY